MGSQFSIPVRMWPIRFLFARRPSITGQVLGIVYHVISLHAGVAARADERKKLEHLCRYIDLHECRVLRRLGIITFVVGQPLRKSLYR
jgi:hypothetical protein